ncbi:MAG: TonB-dependent receptor [Pseudomonadota bacterium]
MKFKSIVSTGASVAAFAAMGAFAHAQEEGERQTAVDRVLQKVTISATKKADVENVQDVPLSVTAFNADSLDALNVTDLQSLSFSTPNVSLDQIGTVKGAANFAIRGLGVNSSIVSIDPAVGTFVDGVYMGINNGVVVELLDLESIELLRGPQGLLFGRNTTGGAVLVNTGNPTDEFEAKLRVNYEGPWADDDRGGNSATVQAVVSGPLIEDTLNGKIAVAFTDDDGYFKNEFTGDDHGALESSLFRGALEYTPTSRLNILGKLEYYETDGDGAASQNRGFNERDSFDLNFDETGNETSESIFGSLRVDYDVDFGNGTITNVLGYRDYEGTSRTDIDGTPFFIFHSEAALEQDQISNELRYAGTFGNAEVTTGVYYFDQEYANDEIRFIPPASAAGFYGGGSMDHTVYGIFGQVDYAFTEKLTGIFGLRYSKEEKDASVTYVRPRAECSVIDGTCPTSGTNALLGDTEGNGFEDSDDWSSWTPKVGFQYYPKDNLQLYGNYTKGFRSGGYNFRITDVVQFEDIVDETGSLSFDQEELDSFELGFKKDTLDGRGQLNAAVFHTIITDMQREVNTPGAAGVVQNIINTADATLTGLELEGRYAVTDNLLLTANVGLIDAEYDEVFFDLSGTTGVIDGDDLDLALPRVPESTYGIGVLYDADLGNLGSLVSRVNIQHRDEVAYTDSNLGWIQEVDYLDANFTWNTPRDGLAVSLYGKNLLDEVQVGGDTQTPFPGPLSNGVNQPFDVFPAAGTFSPLSKGRIIGLELTYTH